jgi:hypothetical protein
MKVLLASLTLLVGCAGNPIIGTWDGPATTTLGTTYHAEVAINGDNTLTYSLIGIGSCSGTLLYTGYTWASDAVTLTFSGTPTCTGALTCGAISIDCSKQTQSSTLGSCTYIMSNANDTLTTQNCTNTNVDATWTRK